jgi:hypothetical protein
MTRFERVRVSGELGQLHQIADGLRRYDVLFSIVQADVDDLVSDTPGRISLFQ